MRKKPPPIFWKSLMWGNIHSNDVRQKNPQYLLRKMVVVRTFRISTLREAFSHLLGLLVLGSENLSQPTVQRLSHSKPTLFKSRHLSYLICFPAHILIPLGFWCCLSLRLRVVYLNLFFLLLKIWIVPI